jgi:hypothetical protein
MNDPALMIAARKRANNAIADLREAGKYASDASKVAFAAVKKVTSRMSAPPAGNANAFYKSITVAVTAAENAKDANLTTLDVTHKIRVAENIGLIDRDPKRADEYIDFSQHITHYARREGHEAREAAERVEQWLEVKDERI